MIRNINTQVPGTFCRCLAPFEADRALDLIDKLLMMPCELSVGLLRLDPVWDPLRDHPRFQAPLKKYETEQ